MKRAFLVFCLSLAILAPALPLFGEEITAPLPAQVAPMTPVSLEDIFGIPAPQNRSIEWNGNGCTATLYCPGYAPWSCTSLYADCQDYGCQVVCDGHAWNCPPPPPGGPSCGWW